MRCGGSGRRGGTVRDSIRRIDDGFDGSSDPSGAQTGRTRRPAATGACVAGRPSLLNAKSGGHNRTLVWSAARAGRGDIVRWLVERGADVNIPGRYRSESFVLIKPYAAALLHGRTDVAAFLGANGTVIDVFTVAFLGDGDRVSVAIRRDPAVVNARQADDGVWRVTPVHHALAGGIQCLS